jgi:hypothetical protein
MSTLYRIFASFILMAASSAALTVGPPPWEFGMTTEAVASFGGYGPYKKFKNDDLETYDGLFNGDKENIQFFFSDTGLHRIDVYMYEGTDLKAAKAKWRLAYDALSSMYGHLEMSALQLASTGEKAAILVLADAAGVKVEAGVKVQVALKKQPSDLFIFSSFSRQEADGTPYYYVTVYYDPAHPK